MAFWNRKPGTDLAIREPLDVERRDPTAATRNVRYVTPGQAQPPDWNATRAFEIAYYSSTAVFACVRLYANTISGLKFRVGADPDKPNDYDKNHPLAKLLGPPPGGPAPKLAARRLWAWTAEQRLVCGRNGWEAELDPSGKAIALWPLPAPYLNPIPSETGTEWWKGFEFGKPLQTRKLDNAHCIYDWDPRGTDFRQPQSSLEAAAFAISVDVMQAKYDYAFLKNDARPPVIIVTEEFEDEDAYEAFKRQWNSSYAGPDNAGRAAFLEATGGGDSGVTGAVDVQVVGVTPKDAQAVQRAQDVQLRIASALGVPWSLIDASGRTFSNAGQEWENWTRTRLVPLLQDFADMVNMQLAPAFGPSVGWFDLAPLGIREEVEPVTQRATADVLVAAQIMTVDEARADYGLPPLPNGAGARMMSADEIRALRGTMPEAPAAPDIRKLHDYKGEGGPCIVCGKPAVHQAHGYFVPITHAAPQSVREALPLAPPALDGPPSQSVEDVEARRVKVWTASDAAVRNLERAAERAFAKLFARQLRSVLARLEAKRGRQVVSNGETRAIADEVFDPDHWEAETLDEARTLFERIADSAGGKIGARFGIAFDLEAPFVQDFVDSRAKQLAGQVTDTTYQAIRDALNEGIGSGEGIPELADRIRHVFDVAQTRATTIARTETIGAYNGAAATVANDAGTDVVAGQEWIATRDARVREQHAERDGERVPVGEPFSGGLMYPGDPAGDPGDTINCRCTVAFLTPDEFGARSVPVGLARAVLALIPTGLFNERGAFDERHMRELLRRAA